MRTIRIPPFLDPEFNHTSNQMKVIDADMAMASIIRELKMTYSQYDQVKRTADEVSVYDDHLLYLTLKHPELLDRLEIE